MIELDPVIFELSNGIKVVYLKRDAYVAHLGVMVHAGSRFEQPNEQGLAHFIEHCIFKGTKKRSAFDVFSDLDRVGGELNAYTNKEEISVHASFRKTHFSIAAELIGDILQNSTFPEKELKKEKEVILDEIMSYLDSPVERIYDEFEAHIYKGHSLGYNILGTKKSVKGFTREDILNYIDRLFTPKNMIVSFVGDVPESEVKLILETEFGSITGEGKAQLEPPVISIPPFHLREKKSNYQIHTLVGGMAPSYNEDNRRAMTLLTNLLGGPALNSRLILSIREKHGYAYNVEANYTPYSDTGYWNIYLGTDKKYLKKAVKLIHVELEKLINEQLTKSEISEAKEQLKGHLALSLDSNLELMFSLGKSVLIFGKVDSMKEIYEQLDLISVEDVQKVAQRYFSADQLSELIFEF
ncbi:MAG: insulinase family protein [Crocinitomicaceae bacterium]|nr:insulinase family protein [Flavobacteriales bacterium]NQZ34139.1 insulinase family protein [Crocinitomicaceae bacterium]